MALSDFTFRILDETIDLSNFDCGDADINEFLKVDAVLYSKHKLALTYLFTSENDVVAFFSISNNCLKDLGEEKGYTRNTWKHFHKNTNIPFEKRIKQYPAVLIGRLGVNLNYQGSGLAYELMDFIKGWVYVDHKPAFRLLLLDAYNRPKQLNYYLKNGFLPLLNYDLKEETRLMYFDMLKLFEA